MVPYALRLVWLGLGIPRQGCGEDHGYTSISLKDETISAHHEDIAILEKRHSTPSSYTCDADAPNGMWDEDHTRISYEKMRELGKLGVRLWRSLTNHMTDHVTNNTDGMTDRVTDSHMGCLDRMHDENHT